MSEQILGALLGLVTTIIGGIFGFALSEISARRREAREARSRAEAVRIILGLEISRNLSTLSNVWESIRAAGKDDSPQRQALIRADILANTPLPPFSRESYKGQLNALPGAVDKAKIKEIFTFYDSLSQVENFRAELLSAMGDQQAELSKFRASQSAPGQPLGLVYAPRRPFDAKAEQNWEMINTTVEAILKAGNPLQP